MSRPTRTFVALPIPSDRAEKLERLQTLIAPSLPNARWIEPEKFHITLAFLGDVPDIGLSPVCRAVAEAASSFPPIDLKLTSLGVFPDPLRPRVVYIGVTGDGLEPLADLQAAITEAVTEAGYPPEDDRFSAHVTIGRLKPRKDSSDDCTPLLRHYERWTAHNFTANEIVTYASQLTPEGPAYVPLGRAPLRGRR